MKPPILYLSFLFTVILACGSDESQERPEEFIDYSFEDSFETNQNIGELFPDDGSRWSTIQQQSPINVLNSFLLNQEIVSEGNQSIEFFAFASDDILSKMNIEKNGFFAPVGSNIIIEADFYIPSTVPTQDLFLTDLECCSCWDTTVPNNQCPGVRLKLSGSENYLSMERGKILGDTFSQSNVPFPKNEWVTIKWEMQLEPDLDGVSLLYQNDQIILNERGKNVPNADEFTNEFASHGIEFQLQEPIGYERFQIGITANPSQNNIQLFVDDVKLSIEGI